MKAYVLKKHGSADVLRISEVASPVCQSHEVKVKVEAIGINYAEILSRKGKYSWAPKMPYTLGMEATGKIVEVGNEITDLHIGQQVIVGGQTGAYAEEICVPRHLAFEPVNGYSISQQASVLVNYMTAWVALFRLGRVNSHDTLLIHAAAGGVGSAAVKLALSIHARVIGTAGNEEKVRRVMDMGAQLAINYEKEDFVQVIKSKGYHVDAVLETVGGEVFKKSFDVLSPFGRMLVAGYASNPFQKWNPWSWYQTWKNAPQVSTMSLALKTSGLMATHIGYLTNNSNLAKKEWSELKNHIEKHNIVPDIGKQYAFDELPEAHKWIESRSSFGKVVVLIN